MRKVRLKRLRSRRPHGSEPTDLLDSETAFWVFRSAEHEMLVRKNQDWRGGHQLQELDVE